MWNPSTKTPYPFQNITYQALPSWHMDVFGPTPVQMTYFLNIIVCSYIATTFVSPAETSCLWILIPFQLWVKGSWLVFSTLNSNQNKYPRSQNPKVASHSGGWEVSVVSVCFPFKTRQAMYVLSRNVTWSTTPTGTKRKIRVYEKEKWRQKERRAKLNLAFHLPFSPQCCLSTPQLSVRCFKCFHCSFPQPSFKSQKERGRGVGNQCHTDVFIPSCLDKRLLSSVVHTFQAESLHF